MSLPDVVLKAAAGGESWAVDLVVARSRTLSLTEIAQLSQAVRPPARGVPTVVLEALAVAVDAFAAREPGWELAGQLRMWATIVLAAGDRRFMLDGDAELADEDDVRRVRARALRGLADRAVVDDARARAAR